MPEIPVGRIEFRVSGRRYDVTTSPPIDAATLIEPIAKEGAKNERQRIRAMVEEMRDKNNAESIKILRKDFDDLLRWLDEEAP